MTQNSIIKDWITVAIQQPSDDQLELFYYDKSNNEFFSIFILDHYLFDKKNNLIEGISIYYSTEELKILKDRFKRIFNRTSSIVVLPKYGIIDDFEIRDQLIESFLTENKINPNSSKIFINLQKDPIRFPAKMSRKNDSRPWWKFW